MADDVLFPEAPAVDRADTVPASHLAALAELGLWGASAPADLGGAGLTAAEMTTAVELLASGCLATAFLWIQHQALLAAALDPCSPAWLHDLRREVVDGRVRGAIALGGLQDPPALHATREGRGWRLDGTSPWVTGWGSAHLIVCSARTRDEQVITCIVDAGAAGLRTERLSLAAANASSTVRLGFEAVSVRDDAVVAERPFDPVAARSRGLRTNGSLALGISRRCCALIGPSSLDGELDATRRRLDEAGLASMPPARAAASLLAVRAATALTVAAGAGAAVAGSHADRLVREAAFTLVFGSRPAIKSALRASLFEPTRPHPVP